MSIFKYLTLSHLQKVLAALETRFKGIENKIDSVPQSDWDENNSSSKSYIQNRTHHKESLGHTIHLDLFPCFFPSDELWEEELTINDETYTMYRIGEFNLMFYPEFDLSWLPTNTIDDYDLSVASSVLMVDGSPQTLTHIVSRNDSGWYGDVLFAYNNEYILLFAPDRNVVVYHTTNDFPTTSLTYDLKLSNEMFEYFPLDNRYLNGTLIINGEYTNSEIFNGLEYEDGFPTKEAIGDGAHIEGGSGNASIWHFLCLSGQAGTTTYSVSNFEYEHYSSVINDKELYIFDDSTYSYQPSNIFVSYYTPFNNTITLSDTLDANSDITNAYYYIPLPISVASSYSHAEGGATYASGVYSHAEGYNTTASGECSHAEGVYTIASNMYSHAEGASTKAYSMNSHAEGASTTASGISSHAEGASTTASGSYSHAEGASTTASGNYSHAEGGSTTASGGYSHAEGYYTTASGNYSHAEGYNTTAQRRSQHVFGEYNILDNTGSNNSSKGSYIEIVGKGTSGSNRSNARTLDWSGNEVLAGKLTVGAAPTNDMDVATKKYVDDHAGGGSLLDLSDISITSPVNGQILMYNSTTLKWENTSLPIYAGDVADYWQGGSF